MSFAQSFFTLAGGGSQYFAIEGENELIKENLAHSVISEASDLAALSTSQEQSGAQLNQAELEREREGLRERGRIMAAAGETAITGSTLLRQINSSLVREGFDIAVINTNKNFLRSSVARKASFIRTQRALQRKQLKSQASSKTEQFLRVTSGATSGFLVGQQFGI